MNRLTRRAFLADCALPALIKPAERPPNIIFLLTDDLGWGDPGCYGNRRLKTPNIDRLAQQGVTFRQFYVASAVCSPSRASLMTGRFTNRHGIHSHLRETAFNLKRGMPAYLDPNQPLLPKLLHQTGYATAYFGKWHLTSSDSTTAPPPAAYGFDENRVTVCDGDGLHRQAGHVPGWNIWESARPGPKWNEWKSKSSELVVDETIRFMEANRNRPFYINNWFFDPHARLTPTALQMEPYKDLGTPFRIYYGAVTNLDRHIGRLLRRMDELGLAENTIVVFSSDNGPEDIYIGNASEHGVGNQGPFRGRKRSGYEGGIRVPFVVRWPGHAAAGKVDETTVLSAVDFLPTMCRFGGAQAPPPEEIGGEDMSAAMLGTPTTRKRPIFWDLREDTVGDFINKSPKLAIREGRWKLMMNPGGTSVELYDIARNPLEVDNLADVNPDVVKRLAGRLMEWKNNPAVTF